MAVPIERIRRVAKQGQLELRCVREEMTRPTATSTSHLPGYTTKPSLPPQVIAGGRWVRGRASGLEEHFRRT